MVNIDFSQRREEESSRMRSDLDSMQARTESFECLLDLMADRNPQMQRMLWNRWVVLGIPDLPSWSADKEAA